MSGYTLYDYPRSSAAYRVRIALNLKGVAWQSVTVSLLQDEQRSPDHLARNPQGLIPALDIGGGTILTQSLAILDWLDAIHPAPRLFPVDPLARARAMALALVIVGGVCDPGEGVRLANLAIYSGAARRTLDSIAAFGSRGAA